MVAAGNGPPAPFPPALGRGTRARLQLDHQLHHEGASAGGRGTRDAHVEDGAARVERLMAALDVPLRLRDGHRSSSSNASSSVAIHVAAGLADPKPRGRWRERQRRSPLTLNTATDPYFRRECSASGSAGAPIHNELRRLRPGAAGLRCSRSASRPQGRGPPRPSTPSPPPPPARRGGDRLIRPGSRRRFEGARP